MHSLRQIAALWLVMGGSACTVNVLSDDELARLYEDAAVAPSNLSEAVSPVGYAADIDLEHVESTVRITSAEQLDEFVTALATPWTRILVDDGVVLTPTDTLKPAVGVKIYCPNGSFTIDGNQTDYVFVVETSNVYLANFILKIPVGEPDTNPNFYGGFDIAGPGADLIYLQNLTIEAPGALGLVDAARSLQVWNADGPAGGITFDGLEVVLAPDTGILSKGVALGGGDSSTVAATIVHSVLGSGESGVKATEGAFIDYVNNISPTVERYHAIEVSNSGHVRARGSFFHPKITTLSGDEFYAQDNGTIIFGPEENTAHPGVTLTPSGSDAPTPPYQTPPIWDESMILDRAGAGHRILPD